MRRLRSPGVLPALFALLVAASPALARALPRVIGLPARPLVAGEQLTLRWSDVGPEVEELELLLSVDGGRHWTIRVSPSSDPARGGWRWRVPDLPTSHARLCVRYGCEGGERLGEPSEEFRIASRALDDATPACEPAPDVGVHEAGWWEPAGRARAAAPARQLAGPRLTPRAPRDADAEPDQPSADGVEHGMPARALTSARAHLPPASPPSDHFPTWTRPRRE
jgi:hypothetical protein